MAGAISSVGPLLVQAGVVCIKENGGPVRVTALRLKRCRDPTSLTDKPEGLLVPDGFARYLLSRDPLIGAPAPATVTD